ncbi:MAG: SidJ-related pseudokinase [Desulfobacterales bacterium]|nr:SidJ-related pseudokinase [Desulfobacterales bacterium]
MDHPSEEIERLLASAKGYNSLFLAAGSLETACQENPEHLSTKGVNLLLSTLKDPRFESRKTALFFYGRLAKILTQSAQCLGPEHPISGQALVGLRQAIAPSTGHRHLALCAAAGLLAPKTSPFSAPENPETPTKVSVTQLLDLAHMPKKSEPTLNGRSLCFNHQDKTLVIKAARQGENPAGLAQEWHWMRALNQHGASTHIGHIPQGLGSPLVHLTDNGLPIPTPIATCFVTIPSYYRYPNEPTAPMETPDAIQSLKQAARAFGYLAGKGLCHTAAVPLFHNRVQANRREDQGIYLWQKGGRLDRWLESCRYPNFGESGLRDFEHMKRAPEMITGELYQTMGDQILSLLLVAGSHFRSLGGPSAFPPFAPEKRDDFRPLFQKRELAIMLRGIMDGYHEGFTGDSKACPLDTFHEEKLAALMVEEMGQDLYMEEVLRARDQKNMDSRAFIDFLTSRGLNHQKALAFTQGNEDIHLHTGPHLGRFNRKISCPEILEFTATLASTTIIDGFLAKTKKNRLI